MNPTPRTPRTPDNGRFPSLVYVGSRIGRSERPTGPSGPCGKADALAVTCRVPDGHVEQHWIFVKCPQRRDDHGRFRVVNGFDEVWDFLRQPFDGHFRKVIGRIHNQTLSRNSRRRKSRAAVASAGNEALCERHLGLILVREMFGQQLQRASERRQSHSRLSIGLNLGTESALFLKRLAHRRFLISESRNNK